MKNFLIGLYLLLFSLLLFCKVNTPLLGKERKEYFAYLVNTPIKIDDKIIEHAWENPLWATGFKLLSAHTFAEKQTFFRIGWDKEFLYIGVICWEPDIAKIKCYMKDGEPLWREDSIEIFLSPKYPLYHQLVVNIIGSKIWVGKEDVNWEVSTSKGDNYWAAEIKIPFTELGKIPKNNEAWRFNIARNITKFDSIKRREFTTWAPLVGSFHDIKNFGYLKFIATFPPKSPIEKYNIFLRKIKEEISECQKELAGIENRDTRAEIERKIKEINKRIKYKNVSFGEIQKMRDILKNIKKEIIEEKIQQILK